MTGKVLRGRFVAGLLYYLFGPGRREEHTDPHLVDAPGRGVIVDARFKLISR